MFHIADLARTDGRKRKKPVQHAQKEAFGPGVLRKLLGEWLQILTKPRARGKIAKCLSPVYHTPLPSRALKDPLTKTLSRA